MTRAIEQLWYPEERESWPRRLGLGPLTLAEGAFRAIVATRNALYDRAALQSTRIEGLRVISIGNLTVGGSGKTPVVIELAKRLLERGNRVAVLSRGYGRGTSELVSFDSRALPPVEIAGDEPLLIARRCPGVTVWVGADRVELARRARAAGANVALLDDGFQHRRLARDGDIVVIDAAVGFGNGHLLPRGPLREPPSSLSRATLIWHAVPAGAELPESASPTVVARHAADQLFDPEGAPLSLDALRGRAVVALAAIARPERFLRELRARGADVCHQVLLRDHQAFPDDALLDARQAAERSGAWIVTTEKDLMRLPRGFGAYVLGLGVQVLEGESLLEAVLTTA